MTRLNLTFSRIFTAAPLFVPPSEVSGESYNSKPSVVYAPTILVGCLRPYPAARRISVPEVSASSIKMKEWAAGNMYTRKGFRVKLIEWIIRRCRLISIIGDPELRDLFTMLNSKINIPGRTTVQVISFIFMRSHG
jgi:hypothetical protein